MYKKKVLNLCEKKKTKISDKNQQKKKTTKKQEELYTN